MLCDVKEGDVVWRLVDPHDGGGAAPQIGWVKEVLDEQVIINFLTGDKKFSKSDYGTHWCKDETQLKYVYDINL